jgi:hypothetical protein
MARPQCDTPLVGMGAIIVNLFFLKTESGYVCKKVDFEEKLISILKFIIKY